MTKKHAKTALTRRKFLENSLAVGCSLAASPLVTPVSFAAVPGDARLVVIILRGGMDGLDVVQPYGDGALRQLRPDLYRGPDRGGLDLDGFFALHPDLGKLHPLWDKGELAFSHAVSTPYRGKRSHFDGQDLLEAGTADLDGPIRNGWLNRLLTHYPDAAVQTAFAIGYDEMIIARGSAPVAEWAPDAEFDISPQAQRLLTRMYADEPVFLNAATEALRIVARMTSGGPEETLFAPQRQARTPGHIRIAEFAAAQLLGPSRIATFSLGGWDTHAQQAQGARGALGRLQDCIITLRDQLGPAWGSTCVLAMTEFGRTVRQNGSIGTDHGTGGAMLMAGGALRGRQVYSDWPGLGEADLLDRRDLMPTRDIRAHAAWVMRGLFGIDQTALERDVFPALDMGAALPILS